MSYMGTNYSINPNFSMFFIRTHTEIVPRMFLERESSVDEVEFVPMWFEQFICHCKDSLPIGFRNKSSKVNDKTY